VSTAFQPDLFQSDSFQIEGGVAATSTDVTIAIIQDSDVVSLNLQLPGGVQPAGRPRRRRQRYMARYKGDLYDFETAEDLEAFVAKVTETERPKPKTKREPVRITLSPDFVEEIEDIRIPPPRRLQAMPQSAALAQVRKLEALIKQRCDEEEEDLLCLL